MKISVPKLVELCEQEQEFYQKEPSLIVKRKNSLCLLRYRPDGVCHKEYADELMGSRGIVVNVESKELVCAPWENKLNYELFKRKFDFTR